MTRGKPRAARNKLLEIVVTIAFLVLLVTIIFPWAASQLGASFAR